MTVLILTMPGDVDALSVKWAVNQLGEDCRIFYSGDLAGGAEWSFNPDSNTLETEFRDRSEAFSTSHFDSIWMRRPCAAVPREHLEDIKERVAAERDSASLLNSVHRYFEYGKFVASPMDATRLSCEKPYQFRMASEVGLPMPATLISNSPARIMKFYADWNGQIVYKPMKPMRWPRKNIGCTMVPTTFIDDPNLLLNCDLRSAPGIFQQKIEKETEIRVTILGASVFAVEKRFPDRDKSELQVDWRGMNKGAEFREYRLPEELLEKCLLLLRKLGLVMGCFDIVTDALGNYYFLEVNPQGQFLWADQVCAEFNQLEAVAEFLISKDSRFTYSRRDRVHHSEFFGQGHYERMAAEEKAQHFGNLSTFIYGPISVPLNVPVPLSDDLVAAFAQAQAASQ